MPTTLGACLPAAGTEGSLHTPLPGLAPTAEPLTLATPPLTTTCGLFDLPKLPLLDMDHDPLISTDLTTAVAAKAELAEEAGARCLRLESLDPTELESLLSDLASGPRAEAPAQPQPDTDPSDATVPLGPWEEEQEEEAEEVQKDHDYCEDWDVLSEFIQLTKPCLEASPDAAALADDGLLRPDPLDFLETRTDLAPLLLASIPVPKAAVPEAAVPEARAEEGAEAGPSGPRDGRYWERRRKNNAASAASRRTRKQRRVALEEERARLQASHDDLQADVARLEALTKEWKARLLTLIG